MVCSHIVNIDISLVIIGVDRHVAFFIFAKHELDIASGIIAVFVLFAQLVMSDGDTVVSFNSVLCSPPYRSVIGLENAIHSLAVHTVFHSQVAVCKLVQFLRSATENHHSKQAGCESS